VIETSEELVKVDETALKAKVTELRSKNSSYCPTANARRHQTKAKRCFNMGDS